MKNCIIFLLYGLLACSNSYAQIGVGTEQPTYEFEVKGNVRFRDLEEKSENTHYRQVRSDNEGRLTAIQGYPEGMGFENITKAFMPNVVSVVTGENKNLGIDLHVSLKPHSEQIVVLTYNIPIYLNNAVSSIIPHFAGIRMVKTIGNNSTILYGASRKFSFPVGYPTNSEVKRGMFLDGKYVDVIRNETNDYVTYQYSLHGFVDGPYATTVFFSDTKGAFMDTMGIGVLSAMMFTKTY